MSLATFPQPLLLKNDTPPRNSLDLNVAAHIRTAIKNEVEQKMLSETELDRYKE